MVVAAGFAIGIERILLALTRQGLARPKAAKDVYLSFAPGLEATAIAEAKRLRAEGKVVELAPVGETEEAAKAMQEKKDYRELRYFA